VKHNNLDLVGAKRAIGVLFKSLNIELQDETPERFAKMIYDLTCYHNISNKEIAKILNKTFEMDNRTDLKNMVLVKNIDAFSFCEHHIALMYDMKISVAYVPKDFVLGLSKIIRLVDMVCKRLQLQERIGVDIVEIMSILTKSIDVAVYIKAKHSCVTARGIRNVSSETITTNFSGVFSEDDTIKKSFLNSV
jgi:GTP cyclohydrolase I